MPINMGLVQFFININSLVWFDIMTPFDDLRRVLSQLPEGDTCAGKKIAAAQGKKHIAGSDGLLALKSWLAIWQGRENPSVDEAHVCVLAACYLGGNSSEVQEFIAAASRGAAPVNRLCVDRGVGLRVLELAPDMPYDPGTPWGQAECMAAVAFGMEATAAGGHLLGLSDFAPGNKLQAVAIIASLGGITVEARLKTLRSALAPDDEKLLSDVCELLAKNEAESSDPLEVLRLYGGREIAASVGAIVAARSRRLPVVVDGWSGLAAVAVLEAELPNSTDHVRIASYPDELAREVVKQEGGEPLVGFAVSSGAGCGNAISVALLKAACDL